MSAPLVLLTALSATTWIRFPGGPRSVAGLGDLDGDGAVEILVGRSGEGRSSSMSGAACVFSTKDASVRHLYLARENCSAFGHSVAPWTDLDGDGVAEFAVSAPSASTRGRPGDRVDCPDDGPGAVFVYSGRTGERVRRLDGLRPGDAFGYELHGGVDLDHDGHTELVVGAPGAGTVCIYSGADGTCRWHVDAPVDALRFGAAVGVAGDVDRDGMDELLVGAPGGARGAAFVFDLARSRVARVLAGGAGGCSEGNGACRFGISVAGAGDVDGDGVPDLLVGADGEGAGRARLFSGATGGVIAELGDSDGCFFSRYGASVCNLGDVDRDGVADFAVADPDDDLDDDMTKGQAPGSVRAYSGKTRRRLWVVTGDGHLDNLGYSIAPAGDVDGDGVGDLVAEAHGGVSGHPYFRVYSGRIGLLLCEFVLPGDEREGHTRRVWR